VESSPSIGVDFSGELRFMVLNNSTKFQLCFYFIHQTPRLWLNPLDYFYQHYISSVIPSILIHTKISARADQFKETKIREIVEIIYILKKLAKSIPSPSSRSIQLISFIFF